MALILEFTHRVPKANKAHKVKQALKAHKVKQALKVHKENRVRPVKMVPTVFRLFQ